MKATAVSEKELVGREAVRRFLRSGLKVGFGTGSTAVWAIREVGDRLASKRVANIVGVATSFQAELECHALGIPLHPINSPEIDGRLDITFDGADEVQIDSQGRAAALIKGGGAALLVEKVVAYNSGSFVVVATRNKLVEHIGTQFPVPVEVIPFARVPVERALRSLGAEPVLREAERKMGPVVTDNGNLIFDVRFKKPVDPAEMEGKLSSIPGVLGNGIFAGKRVTVVTTDDRGGIRVINEESSGSHPTPEAAD